MYGFAWGPPRDMPKFSSSSYTCSIAFWPRPGSIFRPRLSAHSRTITRTVMMNIVISDEVRLTWNVIRAVLCGAPSALQTTWGAGNSRLPLM